MSLSKQQMIGIGCGCAFLAVAGVLGYMLFDASSERTKLVAGDEETAVVMRAIGENLVARRAEDAALAARWFAALCGGDRPELRDDAGDQYNLLGWGYGRGKGKPCEAYQKRARIFSACGGAALYRRSVLDEIGLFDENHFAYLEDMDLGYRARIHGFENVYEPGARVIHYGSASTGSRYNAWKTRRAAANNVYMIY